MPNEVSPRGVHRLELDSALGPWPYGMFPVLALTHRQRWAQTDGGVLSGWNGAVCAYAL